MKAIQRI